MGRPPDARHLCPGRKTVHVQTRNLIPELEHSQTSHLVEGLLRYGLWVTRLGLDSDSNWSLGDESSIQEAFEQKLSPEERVP